MLKLEEAFNRKKALITYITAGDPSLKKTQELVLLLEKSGADIIEIGIPFSDPLADGPVIQSSHIRGLKGGADLKKVFSMVKDIRKKSLVPIIFMLSYNLVLQYGEDDFYKDCSLCGVLGAVIPDLPPEESKENNFGVDNIFMVAPTTKEERIKFITQKSSGFVYLVSSLGITGKRKNLSKNIGSLVEKVKSFTNKPVAVGFGIGTPKQALEISKFSDGIIVGSAIVDLVGKKNYKGAARLVKSLKKAISKG